MADINNIKTGFTLNSILFSGFASNCKFNFNDWTVTAGCDIEIDKEGTTLTIKKFTANKAFIRSNEPVTDNVTIGNLMANGTFYIEGLKDYDTRTPFATFHHHTYDSRYDYKGYGLSFLPCLPDGTPYTYMYPWDLNIPDGLLKDPNKVANIYGYVVPDGKRNIFNRTTFPSNGYSNFQMCFIIHDGNHVFPGNKPEEQAGKIVDISSNPIIIKQYNEFENICGRECWDAYIGDQKVYHRDKTFENCWKKYNFVKLEEPSKSNEEPTHYIFDTDFAKSLNPIVPPIVDLNNHILNSSTGKWIVWRTTPIGNEFWDPIKTWYANNNVDSVMLRSKLFLNSNLEGSLTLNIKELNPDGSAAKYMYAHEAFANCKVNNLTINLKDYCAFSSGNKLFKDAEQLNSLTWTGAPIGGRDLSGIFENCGALYNYPNKLIYWGERGNEQLETIAFNNVSYTFNNARVLQKIPLYDESDRFANSNTIIAGSDVSQLFMADAQLTYVGPVLDLVLVDPNNTVSNMFPTEGFSNITDIRIKNLNHGDWRFDGSGNIGSLYKLDAESVKYLFDNLYDLTLYDSNRQRSLIDIPSKSFNSWACDHKGDSNTGVDIYCNLLNLYVSKSISNKNDILYTNKRISDLRINITGLSGNSKITFGNSDSILYTFTQDGEYTINKDNDLYMGFSVINSTNDINITIINGIDSTNPHHNSASLYCPTEWGDKINQTMISNAQTRGWTIYIGGIKK